MEHNKIKALFRIKKDNGDRCQAYCPTHQDKNPSLTITHDREKNKTLLFCHAGCKIHDIVSAVGLKISDLYETKTVENKTKDEILDIYQYKDENCNVVFEKVRLKSKRFFNRRFIGTSEVYGLTEGTYYETYHNSNKWTLNMKPGARTRKFPGVAPVLYNLPEILKVGNKDTIFIVEGEKDANNLIKLGLMATTNFDGASGDIQKPKWKNEYNNIFSNKNIVLIPDNDSPGKAHMKYVAESLINIASSIKIIELDDIDEKGDISDWLKKGHTKEELLDIVANTLIWIRVNILDFNFSDVGNAERLIAVYGRDVKFNTLLGEWMIWTGTHWKLDKNLEVSRLAKDVIKRLQRAGELIKRDNDSNIEALDIYKKEIKRFVLKSESHQRLQAMIKEAKSFKEVIMENGDEDIFLLNVLNGTIDLRTGVLKSHNRNDNITKIINFEFNMDFQCPNWISFLNKIFQEDQDLIQYVQKVVGYSLTGSTQEQCFFICYGQGANGKSTFLNTIQKIICNYSDNLKGGSLTIKRFDDGPRGDLAKLQGKRFVTSSELNENQVFDESLIKALTGQDIIPVRFMHQEEFPLVPTFKLWIGTNERPKMQGTNYGIWRRLKMIPFQYVFKDDERDPRFFENYLQYELPGILAWAVDGCLKWQKEGLVEPDKVLATVEDYRNDTDCIERFINDCCVAEEGYYVQAYQLYNEYLQWCDNYKEEILSNVKFSKRLVEKSFKKIRKAEGYYYIGIGIKDYCRSNISDNNKIVIPFK